LSAKAGQARAAILTPMLPHSGIVCRAACAGTWRFAG
jgi:hypothetical protein